MTLRHRLCHPCIEGKEEREVSGERKDSLVLDEGFAGLMKKMDIKPHANHNNDGQNEVEVIKYRNVYHPNEYGVDIVKEEEHNGLCLERVFEGINSISTVSEKCFH